MFCLICLTLIMFNFSVFKLLKNVGTQKFPKSITWGLLGLFNFFLILLGFIFLFFQKWDLNNSKLANIFSYFRNRIWIKLTQISINLRSGEVTIPVGTNVPLRMVLTHKTLPCVLHVKNETKKVIEGVWKKSVPLKSKKKSKLFKITLREYWLGLQLEKILILRFEIFKCMAFFLNLRNRIFGKSFIKSYQKSILPGT